MEGREGGRERFRREASVREGRWGGDLWEVREREGSDGAPKPLNIAHVLAGNIPLREIYPVET